MLNISITKCETPKQKPDASTLGFGKIFTDHMFIADYSRELGWYNARIVPFANISLHPASTVLHYGSEIFEGLKAYRRADGKVQLFRPLENIRRMNNSAERLCLPQMPEEDMLQALLTFVELEQDWTPSAPGTSLYLRPFLFGNDETLGVHAVHNATFVIIASPVGSYYAEGINRYLYSALKDEVFVEWANDFFADERHFLRPIALDEMILSYLEMRSDAKVTEKLITDTKKKFRKSLRTYCDNYGIIPNPGVVYIKKRKPKDWDEWTEAQRYDWRTANVTKSDSKEGLTRASMWTTRFVGDRPAYDRPRELCNNRGYYFFRSMQDVPAESWDLLPAEEVDWEKMME